MQTKTVYSGGWKSCLGQDDNGYNEIGDPDNAVGDVYDESFDDAYVNYNDDGDIYIMVKCLSVCLSVTKNDHFL